MKTCLQPAEQAAAEPVVQRKKLVLRHVTPAAPPAMPLALAATPATPAADPRPGQGLTGRIRRLDEALVRLRARLRDEAEFRDAIEAAVDSGAAVQVRVSVRKKATGGTKASLDVRAFSTVRGFNVGMRDLDGGDGLPGAHAG